MGLLTFSINITLDGCVDHQEGIADDETHAFFTRLMDEAGAMLWGRGTYEMMESYWPAVARGDEKAPSAMREWAVKLDAKPKYVVSSTRNDFPWTNSHHIAGDLRTGVQKLKDATPAGVLLGSGKLAAELDRQDLIDEYKFLVHPRIAGHGPTLYQSGLPSTRRLELVSATPLRSGVVGHALPARALTQYSPWRARCCQHRALQICALRYGLPQAPGCKSDRQLCGNEIRTADDFSGSLQADTNDRHALPTTTLVRAVAVRRSCGRRL
jgi:dihydrofolate reductase